MHDRESMRPIGVRKVKLKRGRIRTAKPSVQRLWVLRNGRWKLITRKTYVID